MGILVMWATGTQKSYINISSRRFDDGIAETTNRRTSKPDENFMCKSKLASIDVRWVWGDESLYECRRRVRAPFGTKDEDVPS